MTTPQRKRPPNPCPQTAASGQERPFANSYGRSAIPITNVAHYGDDQHRTSARFAQSYLALVKLEVEEFGAKPTEVRHLLGRLGEFECEFIVGGTLAHRANQHGFDVIAKDGRKISVKTTAQKTGFVAISQKTLHHADDLMLPQYENGQLLTVYYGCIRKAVSVARIYDGVGKYELDISKARTLSAQRVIQHNSAAFASLRHSGGLSR